MNLNYLHYISRKPFKSWRNKYLKYITRKEADNTGMLDLAIREISEYTGEDCKIVKEKHKAGAQGEKSREGFLSRCELNKEFVEAFYREFRYYLYELPLWNAERNRPKYLVDIASSYLKRNHYNKVIDFGAGAGDLCIELYKRGLDVTYCDISNPLFKLSEWRFRRRNMPIKMLKGIDNVVGDYDCILSFDVFEHIKDLPVLLPRLISHIKSGGSIIFSGAFSGGGLHLRENEKYNDFKQMDLLMQDLGLSFQDKFAQYMFYKKN